MHSCGHLWTPLGHLRIRRLGVRVAPGALSERPGRSSVGTDVSPGLGHRLCHGSDPREPYPSESRRRGRSEAFAQGFSQEGALVDFLTSMVGRDVPGRSWTSCSASAGWVDWCRAVAPLIAGMMAPLEFEDAQRATLNESRDPKGCGAQNVGASGCLGRRVERGPSSSSAPRRHTILESIEQLLTRISGPVTSSLRGAPPPT